MPWRVGYTTDATVFPSRSTVHVPSNPSLPSTPGGGTTSSSERTPGTLSRMYPAPSATAAYSSVGGKATWDSARQSSATPSSSGSRGGTVPSILDDVQTSPV